jgi:hypothetical protein
MAGQSIPPKTPEQIRAERIAAIDDPKLRQQLEEMVKARDAKLAEVKDQQDKNFDRQVQQLRTQKINSAHGPQLLPPGELSRYRGPDGFRRAHADADLQVRTQNPQFQNAVAKEHNNQIDKHLDNASREATRPAVLQRSATNATNLPSPRSNPKAPNRYAQVIDSQNYAARAAKEAEANRQREREQQQQRQQQRGPQR